jgi:PST family polysaccharide transporter
MTEHDSRPLSPERGGKDELHALVRGGMRAALGAQVASQLLSLVVLAILYRLLRPEDYGLLGMALPAAILPRMAATLGLSAAVIQPQELSHGQRTSLFWLMQLAGAAAALVTAAIGPLLAAAYGQPTLSVLCAALAGSTLLASAGQTHQSLLERRLAMRPLAWARLAALAAGGVAGIAGAWRDWGVWALVLQQAAELGALTLLAWLLEPWRPAWPTRGQRLGTLAAFSGYYTASALLFWIAQNLDKLLFPWLLGDAARLAIGLYSQAMGLVLKIVYVVTAPLAGVMLPALSRAAAQRELYADLTASFLRMASIALFPAGVGLFLVAPEVMLLLGGPPWKEGGPILAALAPILLVQGLLNLSGNVFASAGQGRRLLAAAALMCLLLAQGIMAGWVLAAQLAPPLEPDGGQRSAVWMAAGYTLVTIVVLFYPYLSFCLRGVDVAPQQVLSPLAPALRGALLMGLVVWGTSLLLNTAGSVDYRVRLAVLVGVGVLVYAVAVRAELAWVRRELAGEPPTPRG